jgi:uncharacterized protein YjdB
VRAVKKRSFYRLYSFILIALLLAGIFGGLAPTPALAAGGDITIEGDGLNNPGITITQKQLRGEEDLPTELQAVYGQEKLEQHDEWYSTINTWPTKSFYRGQGVRLADLLELAGGLNEDATQIRFTASDGFKATFTVQELLHETRYQFPNFIDYDLPAPDRYYGQVSGDTSKAAPVEPIIAHKSFSANDFQDLLNDGNFSVADANHLLYGQRAVTQQTNSRFAKYVTKIEVLTDPPAKWDSPTAHPVPGQVPVGTKVKLCSTSDDEDKVHYTLDGSEPTIESPMYNWIAKRWQSNRQDVLDEINRPIEITEDTTIKAFVTGPGRSDSDIVTFEYTIPNVPVTGVCISEGDQELEVGLKVQLTAFVEPEDATNKTVTWSSSDESKATVSESGLVTALAEGTADITVTTEDGDFTYCITINVIPGEPEAIRLLKAETTTEGDINLTFNKDMMDPSGIGAEDQFIVLVDDQNVDVTAVAQGTAPDEVLLELVTKITAGQTVTLNYIKSEEESKQIRTTEGEALESFGPVDVFNSFLLPAPDLKADTTDNVVGMPIDLTFEDDEDWRNSISEVNVDGKVLQQDGAADYTVSSGTIRIAASVFTSARSYTIVVKAVGYQDATVIQTIKGEGSTPGPIDDGDIVLTITGDGVAKTKTYTQSQLEVMPQVQEVYSCINTWPTKKWYVGKGVALSYLLGPKQADIKSGATLIRFSASDGYYMTLTVQELLRDRRYRFPNFKTDDDGDGHIPGSTKGAVEVGTILGLTTAEGTDDPRYMNELNALLLMPGQRAVTEQTGPLFVKNVNKIEVLTKAVPKWDKPQADPDSGTVQAGTEVRLSNINMDQDKIHYTTDGSTPTLDSPIYNWIASRWWSARGDETVEKINHPIELTKDTTIKAVTIGPGKKNSDVVTFTYKVTGAARDTSYKLTPGEGGTVSLENDVVMEIPAGALTGISALEVKIERVKEPPVAPAGFRLLGDVYEFSVDGEKSYNFAKKVKIKFSFHSKALGKDETPAVHYYDEAQRRWVNIGGKVSDNTISVEVDHLTKYGVMVSLPAVATTRIKPSEGGKLNLGGEAIIEIPSGALTGTSALEVKIERVKAPPAAPAGFKLLGDVFEFSIDGKKSYNFAKKVKIKLGFDSKALDKVEAPAIYYYDEVQSRWEEIEGTISDSTITVEVDHLTKFAVIAAIKPEKLQLIDIAGHWANDNIMKLVALGAISGYPDSSFKPDNNITRAEFATVMVKACQLENKDGKTFADTAAHWAKDYIATAAIHGIVTGYDDNTFGPDDLLTREQMAVMIIRAAKLAPEAGELRFADNSSISDWARSSLATAVKNGIIKGYPDNTVRPRGLATRAEAVTVIVKVLDKQEK